MRPSLFTLSAIPLLIKAMVQRMEDGGCGREYGKAIVVSLIMSMGPEILRTTMPTRRWEGLYPFAGKGVWQEARHPPRAPSSHSHAHTLYP
jgi:hypothetical protein